MSSGMCVRYICKKGVPPFPLRDRGRRRLSSIVHRSIRSPWPVGCISCSTKKVPSRPARLTLAIAWTPVDRVFFRAMTSSRCLHVWGTQSEGVSTFRGRCPSDILLFLFRSQSQRDASWNTCMFLRTGVMWEIVTLVRFLHLALFSMYVPESLDAEVGWFTNLKKIPLEMSSGRILHIRGKDLWHDNSQNCIKALCLPNLIILLKFQCHFYHCIWPMVRHLLVHSLIWTWLLTWQLIMHELASYPHSLAFGWVSSS